MSKLKVKDDKLVNQQSSGFKYSSNNDFFSLNCFDDNTIIEVTQSNEDKIVLEIKGIDASLANALRRILISEIPTMAIENCTFYQNTSIIPDEILAHRLGLIPIKVDANLFNEKGESEEFNEFNSLMFKLHVLCDKEEMSVYSNELKWIPQGNQSFRIQNAKPVHDDILIAKLKKGQEIEVELVCVKGTGKIHAKWSPVCTAYYRLLPDIVFKSVIKNEKAKQLKELCPMGVFDIEDSGKIYVKNVKKCTMCRECIRDTDFKEDIELGKLENQYECKLNTYYIYYIFLYYFIYILEYW
jgi:DNA-directed RNA polymerase I and III subunit RPAC1